MLLFQYFLKGIIIGFIVSAPIGPVGTLCIKRTLSHGRLSGYATSLGAVMAEGYYAGIAAFGLSFFITFLEKIDFWLKLVGGCVLLFMGVIAYRRKIDLQVDQAPTQHLGQDFTSAMFINCANLFNLFAYLAIFSGFGLESTEHNFMAAFSLLVGVLVGSGGWWFLLTEMVSWFRKKLSAASINSLNKVTSVLVFLFGLFVLSTLVFNYKIFGHPV